ncbi:syndecan isoform X1 [Toxorhynchites rutilus septentrionalis]|uniref:syndecan isoform X1 n=1 Tax=Toxorhynchites rutilus septentrionalis TaxID=329112 RepID=UPI002479E6A0|nr:syndecan isoform X1 [Toxorhynchites rutilus septentrionalis]
MYLKRIYISTTLLAFFMLTTPWSALAQDEQKSNNRNSQSLSASFGAGGASSPNNDIYIDDEVLEGSGSRGEIRDDLEKEDDESSGSGYGDDDEDSSSSSSRSNTNSNTNLGVSGSKDKSRISETSAGGSGDHETYVDEDEDDLYTETKRPSVDPSTTDDEDMPIGKDNSKQSGTSITHGGQSPDGDLEISHTHQHITPTDSGHDSNNAYGGSGVLIMNAKNEDRTASFFAQPGILAAVIGGAVVGLLCAILVVMFIVYRMRKKDEGSYALDEPKRSPTANTYAKNANNREFYA